MRGLSERFAYQLDDGGLDGQAQLARYDGGECRCSWRSVGLLPEKDDFFENVWRSYWGNGNIF